MTVYPTVPLLRRIINRIWPCEFGGDCAFPYRTVCPHRRRR